MTENVLNPDQTADGVDKTEEQLDPSVGAETEAQRVGRWDAEEHARFLEGHNRYGRDWKKIAELVMTRSVVQVRTHAQKYFQKLAKEECNNSADLMGSEDGSISDSTEGLPVSPGFMESQGVLADSVSSMELSSARPSALDPFVNIFTPLVLDIPPQDMFQISEGTSPTSVADPLSCNAYNFVKDIFTIGEDDYESLFPASKRVKFDPDIGLYLGTPEEEDFVSKLLSL